MASIGVGYQLGALSIRDKPTSTNESSATITEREALLTNVEKEQDEDEDAEGIPDGDLSAVSAGFLEQCKLVCLLYLRYSAFQVFSKALSWYNIGPCRTHRSQTPARRYCVPVEQTVG